VHEVRPLIVGDAALRLQLSCVQPAAALLCAQHYELTEEEKLIDRSYQTSTQVTYTCEVGTWLLLLTATRVQLAF